MAGLLSERANVPVVAAVLAAATVVGFVGGGVLGSLTGLDRGTSDDFAVAADEPTPPVRADVTVVGASCERPPAVDSARTTVEYKPQFAANGDLDSAWQCRGDGAGETLELDLGGVVVVVAVGLVPGYAKVDPHDGTEWYPLNRRLTEVVWHFGDGTAVAHQLDPDPDLRDLQTIELPEPVETSTLVVEIVSSTSGSSTAHPNVAISDLEVLVSPAVVAGALGVGAGERRSR